MEQRNFNFSAGPAALPLPVLEQAQRDMLALPGVGASILEISHRSKAFRAIHEAAKSNLKQLLAIPDDYSVLFLQGGSRLQFSMVAMNLMAEGDSQADYLVTGTWGKGAAAEARKFGRVNVVWDGSDSNYDRLPASGDYQFNPAAAYAHITSNETIQGVQFPAEPDTGGVPLVCDSSSDFLHKPLDISKYGILYACAQKNAGPAGVTVVITRNDLLERSRDDLPGYLNYKNQAENDSLWNTAPTFAIYVLRLVTDWLREEIGGLAAMYEQNKMKAAMLYDVIDDAPDFYQPHAQAECRSVMNVTFRLPSEDLTTKFVSAAADRGLAELKGHRSVGGIRASIYNAMPVAGVESLRDFMVDFRKAN